MIKSVTRAKPEWLAKMEREHANAPALALFEKTKTGKMLRKMALKK